MLAEHEREWHTALTIHSHRLQGDRTTATATATNRAGDAAHSGAAHCLDRMGCTSLAPAAPAARGPEHVVGQGRAGSMSLSGSHPAAQPGAALRRSGSAEHVGSAQSAARSMSRWPLAAVRCSCPVDCRHLCPPLTLVS